MMGSLKKFFSHMLSGDLAISSKDSVSDCHGDSVAESASISHKTQSACEQPYEQFQYKEDVVQMFKMLGSNVASSKDESVQPEI